MPRRSDVLTEGMRPNDLKDIVLPLVSVDEWVSKVDPKNAVVFGFYVHDRDAANDLDRFVQKSPVPLLDTDVSPAPDQHGYFLVFVELLRGDDLAENVRALLDEISPLADVDEWRMRVRKTDGLVTFSEDALRKSLPKPEQATNESAILHYLSYSDVLGARLDEGDLLIDAADGTIRYEIKGFGREDELLLQLSLSNSAIGLSLAESLRSQRMAGLLGPGWLVHEIAGMTALCAERDERILLLRKL